MTNVGSNPIGSFSWNRSSSGVADCLFLSETTFFVRALRCLIRRERELVSERRWCARADEFARFGADAAETMRAAALEIISVAGSEDPAFTIHGHLESAAENDTAFFAIVNQRDTSGVATRFVTLLQDLERAAEQIIADLSKGDGSLADLG